jgi:ferric-chelate reductase
MPDGDSSQSFNTSVFVFHIDLVLLGLFALYVVLTLPRVLQVVHRFQRSGEILNGFFLRSGSGAAQRTTSQHRSDTHGSSSATNTLTSTNVPALVDDSENAVEGEMSKSGEAQRPALIIPQRAAAAPDVGGYPSRRSAPSPPRVPTRVPRWMRILRPTLAYALNFRVAPGFSFGNLLVLLVYTALMLYASFRGPNSLVHPHRLGYLAISQVPIVVALAGKTNWLSLACGVGYEKV